MRACVRVRATRRGGQLETVYLEHNPVQAQPDYLPRILAALPSLTQIDANPIRR